jgi:very-short-patch-repair endonuclease
VTSKFSRTEEITERARDLREDVSKTESKLWPKLCKGRMGASFRRQHPIGPFFADYCCPALKLVIEVDGPFHSAAEDAARDQFMVSRGYDVLRFSVEDMDRRFKDVIETIHIRVQLGLQERVSRNKPTSP